MDAELTGLVAGRRHHAARLGTTDCDGTTAKVRVVALLDGRIKGVHVDVDDLAWALD
jgi:hypothetical protein